ncbi:hypothetical protein [Sphingorhabdus sp. EL138]|uniref:hypothetical protein n=1 Tax=Sphingorhabdus sp. EL138 TaxID=2073156 RepID=UPI0025D6C143|nr:hypothetical protein [Sphingorhabdus sp. EL138]
MIATAVGLKASQTDIMTMADGSRRTATAQMQAMSTVTAIGFRHHPLAIMAATIVG